jgi:hypothetical protein
MRGHTRRWRSASRALIALAAGGLLIAGLTSAASAAPQGGPTPSSVRLTRPDVRPVPRFVTPQRAVRLPAGQIMVCPQPTQPGQMACQAVIEASAKSRRPASAATAVPGYGPSSLLSAYDLASAAQKKGRGVTVAIVDAFSNPDLARNLAVYRRHFGLPACAASSGCLRIVNQTGRAGPLPARNIGWGSEESLDLDMVSAICPHCRILLVEANSADTASLGVAEDTAVAKGARFVSNSWGGGEFTSQDTYDHYFNHPGDAIVFASGDSGYGSVYPTDTQYVTAVGGTSLRHRRSGGRAWTEAAWGTASDSNGGTGSGCSTLEAKPSWQRETVDENAPGGCLNRTEVDVSADADPHTGVAVYDSYGMSTLGGPWIEFGGTSEATPIITAVYALAGTPARGTYPASYPYQHASHFNDVTSGLNGRCEANRQYLCHARRGYDGPTGLGTPKGTSGFSSAGTQPVTVLDPGVQDVGVSAAVRVTVAAVDSDGSARSLAYSARGLPAGLTIGSVSHSLDGVITGTTPATAGSYQVTVTAKDRRTGRTGLTRFAIYVVPSMTATNADAPAAGNIVAFNNTPNCMAAATDTPGTAVEIEPCGPTSAWQYRAGAGPGAPGTLATGSGNCLGLTGNGHAILQTCADSSAQQFEYLPISAFHGSPYSVFYNPGTGRCLSGGGLGAGTALTTDICGSSSGDAWTLPSILVTSGLAGQCLSTGSAAAVSAGCAGADGAESWQVLGAAFQSNSNGFCLEETFLLDGAGTTYENCGLVNLNPDGFWQPGPDGELINADSGRCLDNPGSGRPLVQEDCYGQPGEIWALN